FGAYAERGEIFLNTDTDVLFFCRTGYPDPQVWLEMCYKADITSAIAAIPQADWAQTDDQASDYILNKPIPSQVSATRSLDTVFQINENRDCMVSYSVSIGTELSLTGGE